MLLFSLAILFTGCDYWCQDEYHVINNTDDTLQIIVNYDTLRLYGSWQTGENMDSRLNDTTHVVYPHSKIAVSYTHLLPATDTIITTDPLRLKQVINNLINNAIKFTSKGAITLGYRQNNDQVSIFVKDTGTGIDEDKINRIFERFYKGEMCIRDSVICL